MTAYTDDDVTAGARAMAEHLLPECFMFVTPHDVAKAVLDAIAPAIAARARLSRTDDVVAAYERGKRDALTDPAHKALVRADALSDALAVMSDSDDLDEARERVTMLFRDAVGVRARAEQVDE